MPDAFILRILTQPITILDNEYAVIWHEDKARVCYTQSGEEYWTMLSPIFDSQLEAHAYLMLLASLAFKPDNNWRNI